VSEQHIILDSLSICMGFLILLKHLCVFIQTNCQSNE
jgi:hypothetical protein